MSKDKEDLKRLKEKFLKPKTKIKTKPNGKVVVVKKGKIIGEQG